MKKMKRYQEMNTAELAKATREYDAPGTIDRTRPMTAAQRLEERNARHAGGRPRSGQGAARINVTIERGLLAEADALAQRHKIGRSELIARGLRLMVSRNAS